MSPFLSDAAPLSALRHRMRGKAARDLRKTRPVYEASLNIFMLRSLY